MPSDYRVPMDPILEAFGVPVTVTRPAPDQEPIETTGVWGPPLVEQEVGGDFDRRAARKWIGIPRATVPPPMPRGTLIVAPEVLNGTSYTWRVEGLFDEVEPDEWRVIVRKVATV